jgi:hypothetical protein
MERALPRCVESWLYEMLMAIGREPLTAKIAEEIPQRTLRKPA